MYRIKIFCPFASSKNCKETYEKINYSNTIDFYGKESGVSIARKHISWYTNSMRNSKEFRNIFNKIKDHKEAISEIVKFYEANYT
jgi:tRNA-dihydrouridine synthase